MKSIILSCMVLAILVVFAWEWAPGAAAAKTADISTDESYAFGNITFLTDSTATRDLLVPVGTKVFAVRELDLPSGHQRIYYETVEMGIIKAGKSEVTVACRALDPGPDSNVAAYEIKCIESYLMGIYKCENREPVEDT